MVGVVAVAPGDGFAAIFRSLNVDAVIGGGQTMNPSTEDLLQAIERLPQRDVIVLPNNGNIVMAARQAAELSAKRVRVLPTKTLPQGIAAKLSFNYQAGLDENLRAMEAALKQICTAEITVAVRDATVDGVQVRIGQTIGLLDGELVAAADDRAQVIDVLLGRMDLDTREIVTIYYGQGATRPRRRRWRSGCRRASPMSRSKFRVAVSRSMTILFRLNDIQRVVLGSRKLCFNRTLV